MHRTLFKPLKDWLASSDRKPLVLRGARQVGKTWLVKHLAQQSNKVLIELNFEKQPSLITLFNSNDTKQVLSNLSATFGKNIDPENSLLFLDEIQTAPVLFSKLRWFAEDLPQLPVIAAGSLLEFVLADHTFSMPVGRISYMHLEPMSFEEFLFAKEEKTLHHYLINYTLNNKIPEIIHEKLTLLFKEYILIGGMPAAVSNWITENSFNNVSRIQHDLLTTYREDFNKYKGKIETIRLDEVMMAIPRMLGKKIIYKHINSDMQSNAIKKILSLLEKARVCNRVSCSSSNGIPLKSEIRENYFKEIFLDTGLCSAALGLEFDKIIFEKLNLINNGGIAEQVTGQLLRTITPPYIEPELYCWSREEATSSAEIDYVIQHGNNVIPVEVKAGATGSLKSLHFFMELKNYSLAMRVNADLPSITEVSVKNSTGHTIQYKLLSIPFYLIEQTHRLLEEARHELPKEHP